MSFFGSFAGNKLNISLDSLMTGSVPDSNPQENRRSCMIRVTSPNENVIMDVSKVMRSQEFRGGNNSPKYTLFASDSREMSFWGAQNTFLAWYRNLEDIRREIREIQKALDTGSVSYTLQYSLYRSSDRKGDTVLWVSIVSLPSDCDSSLSVVGSFPPRKMELSQLPMMVSALSLYKAFS